MRTLALPKTAEPWSLTSLREKLIKIGARVVSHGHYVTFQMAEVAVPRQMFAAILTLIARPRAPPEPREAKRATAGRRPTTGEARADESRLSACQHRQAAEAVGYRVAGLCRLSMPKITQMCNETVVSGECRLM